jgi:uncharacterized protein (TIGR02271 family)
MIKQLTHVAGIVSVAGLLAACATNRHYTAENTSDPCATRQTAYNSTAYEASGAQAEAMPAEQGQIESTQAQGNQVAIPLYEERVNVGKQEIPGQVQIRKYTTTETVNVPVQLRHEHVVVERVPAGGQSSQSQWSGAPFQDKSITLQVENEQPIVQKQVVETGQVIARKDSQTQQINVQQQVRKEDVAIDRNNNPNVEVRGNFNEAAGAQAPDQQQQQQFQQEQQQQQQQQPLQSPKASDQDQQ